MAQVELNGKTVECVRGDITRQDDLELVEAVFSRALRAAFTKADGA